MRNRHEKGIALVTALLVMLLISTIIVGLSWLVMSDQRLGGNNRDRQSAFYGAEAGMEKMTADLGNQFNQTYALSAADINAVVALGPPALQGVNYPAPGDNSGYTITWGNAPANPVAQNHAILSGPYAGLNGLLTAYTMRVRARTVTGSEVNLQRIVQTVAIPVFQFGIFCQGDCSFFAGPNFNFGGRVHTNSNLWLAEGTGSTLTLSDKVTAVGQIIRSNLANGLPVPGNYDGIVSVDTVPNTSYRPLANNEGSNVGPSVVGAVDPTPNNPPWNGLSIGTYNGDIRNGATGAQTLTLTIATPAIGGNPIDLIRRPVAGEQGASPLKFAERYFSQASLRILVSDYNPPNAAPNSGACATADMVGLDTVTGNPPEDLASLSYGPGAANGAKPAWLIAGNFSLPASGHTGGANYNSADGYWLAATQPTITGCIKIEYQNAANAWVDVTREVLNLGYTGRNLNPLPTANEALPANAGLAGALPPSGTVVPPSGCADPSPNAVIRLARLRDNPSTRTNPNPCGTAGAATPTDFWPTVLFDPREAVNREIVIPGNKLTAAGVMNYVELDVTNLARWFTGAIGVNGPNAIKVTGYTVYFTDRRSENVDPVTNTKTGSYGYNNFVNANDVNNGCPDGVFDQGEDLEGDNIQRLYGATPVFLPVLPNVLAAPGAAGVNAVGSNPFPGCSAFGFGNPVAVYFQSQDARINPPGFFRRALKLVNGGQFAIGVCDTVPCGLTVVAENPVYIQGDYNSLGAGNFNGGNHQATSVLADAVTLLSNNWNDVNSFISPYSTGGRPAITTTYRTAIVSGKGLSFPRVGAIQDFGTDGGTHNFLRYIEGWGGQQLFYRGSIVSFFYNRQAVGVYKCCGIVYDPPTRGYNFDVEFLDPTKLPPRTPMFRTINTIGFTQQLMPNAP